MSAASRFADKLMGGMVRKGCIPKDTKRGEVICFQEAKGEAEKKAEKIKQQKVAK